MGNRWTKNMVSVGPHMERPEIKASTLILFCQTAMFRTFINVSYNVTFCTFVPFRLLVVFGKKHSFFRHSVYIKRMEIKLFHSGNNLSSKLNIKNYKPGQHRNNSFHHKTRFSSAIACCPFK